MLHGCDTLICYAMLVVYMGQRSTYYTESEEQALDKLAEERGESFSGLVRQAIQEKYDL